MTLNGILSHQYARVEGKSCDGTTKTFLIERVREGNFNISKEYDLPTSRLFPDVTQLEPFTNLTMSGIEQRMEEKARSNTISERANYMIQFLVNNTFAPDQSRLDFLAPVFEKELNAEMMDAAKQRAVVLISQKQPLLQKEATDLDAIINTLTEKGFAELAELAKFCKDLGFGS